MKLINCAFRVAIKFGGNLYSIEMLIKAESENRKVGNGTNPVQWALEKENRHIVEYLETLK